MAKGMCLRDSYTLTNLCVLSREKLVTKSIKKFTNVHKTIDRMRSSKNNLVLSNRAKKKVVKKSAAKEPAQYASINQTRVADFTREQRFIDTREQQVVEWADYGELTSTSTASGYYSFSTVFTDLPDNANYSGAFDQYRIDSIEYHFLPMTQLSAPGTAPAYANLFVYHDYDDVATPVTQSAARSYGNLTIVGAGEKHIRKIRPHIAAAATTSGAASIVGAINVVSTWLDTSSTGIPHYGVKAIVTQSNSTAVSKWYLYARIEVSLRNQK
jgi:hypothetical protein